MGEEIGKSKKEVGVKNNSCIMIVNQKVSTIKHRRMNTVIQCNVNNSYPAHMLVMQEAAESNASLVALSEPFAKSIPPRAADWLVDESGRAALHCRGHPGFGALVSRGDGFVAALWGQTVAASVYFSPRWSCEQTERALTALKTDIEHFKRENDKNVKKGGQKNGLHVLIMGDLNAWSTLWGSRRTNAKGRLVGDFIAALGLGVLNTPGVSTCRRPQGVSTVDVTLGSAGLIALIRNWKVWDEKETLSDHLLITFEVVDRKYREAKGHNLFPIWKYSPDRDGDLFGAAVLTLEWPVRDHVELEKASFSELMDVIESIVMRACQAVLRVSKPEKSGHATWWSAGLSRLRSICNRSRRFLARHRDVKDEGVRAVVVRYRSERNALKNAIRKARKSWWAEQIASIDRNPWGRPYKTVMRRLRGCGPSVTSVLPMEKLQDVVGELFPRDDFVGKNDSRGDWSVGLGRRSERHPFSSRGMYEWDNKLGETVPPPYPDATVDYERLQGVLRRCRINGRKAPGPDGLVAPLMIHAMMLLLPYVHRCFNLLLKYGIFPGNWKVARLVLLPKRAAAEGRRSYRPLCMINEMGKIYERVVITLLEDHVEGKGGLAEEQFGFRRRRSTVDAIDMFRGYVRRAREEGKYVLAISLDIKNAFGSIPWSEVDYAMHEWDFPGYLKAVVKDYLSGRLFCFERPGNCVAYGYMEAGVPQGSVIGPFLWNLVFNKVLLCPLPPWAAKVAYADDTLILVKGDSISEVCARATRASEYIIEAIKDLGLQLAVNKTAAIMFHPSRRGRTELGGTVCIAGHDVIIEESMKYLGVYIDSNWSFVLHARYISCRAEEVVGALSPIMPNLRGPRLEKRKLYANVVHSVILYAVPVWASLVKTHSRNWQCLQAAHGGICRRVIAAYRTASYVAACVIAGIMPIDILIAGYADMYRRYREYDILDDRWVPLERLQKERVEEGLQKWMLRIAPPTVLATDMTSLRLRVAFSGADVLRKWMVCKHRAVDFHLAQVLTGHGCFSAYLHRIGRLGSPLCRHCDARVEDTVEHTVEVCPAWARARHDILVEVGDLSLGNLVRVMVASKEGWAIVARFCNQVMLSKEVAERARERKAREKEICSNMGRTSAFTVRRGGTVKIRRDVLKKGLFGGKLNPPGK